MRGYVRTARSSGSSTIPGGRIGNETWRAGPGATPMANRGDADRRPEFRSIVPTGRRPTTTTEDPPGEPVRREPDLPRCADRAACGTSVRAPRPVGLRRNGGACSSIWSRACLVGCGRGGDLKQAFTYAFDRITGAPCSIEERPAPRIDSREWYSPTQFVPDAPCFDRQGVTVEDSSISRRNSLERRKRSCANTIILFAPPTAR